MSRFIRSALRAVLPLALVTAAAGPAEAGFLLVVNSGTRSVLAVNDQDGSVINPTLISDPTRLQTPINAIDSGRGTILVSDQVADAIFEYTYLGTFVRTLVSGIDNVRGIAVRDGILYAAQLGSGASSNTIQRFNVETGASLGVWTTSQINSPWDIFFRATDALVSNSGSNRVERYDFNGNHLGTLITGGGNGIAFPQQIHAGAGGNLLIGGFSLPSGLYEFSATGTQLNVFAPNLGQRAGYLLGNGLLLFSAGTRLATVNPTSGAVVDIINAPGNSFRFIEFTPVPEPSTAVMAGLGLLALSGLAGGSRRHPRRSG